MVSTAMSIGPHAPENADDLERGVRELPDQWLNRSVDVMGWANRWLEAWNTHDLDALTALVTDDIVWEDPAMFGETVHGKDEFRAFTETFFCAFPDVHFDVVGRLYLATEGVELAAPWRMTATFSGELALWGKRFGANPPAYAPTGRRVEIEGIDLWELRDGLLSRWTILYDLFDFARQVGLAPPAGGAMARLMVRGQRLAAPILRRRANRRLV
jgi:steroid delta-isomerase-like uncharacterized protein